MKKILLFISLFLFYLSINAQDTIYNLEQTYLFPPYFSPGFGTSISYQHTSEATCLQRGNGYTTQPEGMKIYGIAVALKYEAIPENKYVFLYEEMDGEIVTVDSCLFSDAEYNLLCLPFNRIDTTYDTLVDVYHVYFTRPHNIDQNNFYITYGNSKSNPVSCLCSPRDSCSFIIEYAGYLMVSTCCDIVIFNCSNYYDENHDFLMSIGATTDHTGIFPIIDRNLWQPCRPVTGLRSYVYHDRVSFFWDEAYGTCNYELKWGLADDDTSNYQTYYTNSTAAMFYGIEREQEYACLVRSQCLCNDSIWGSEWGPWSDTIHFRRTRFIDAESNNPDWGYVVGGGHYDLWDTVTLEAIPSSPRSTFVSWSDSNTANPRTIIVSQDLTLTAIFAFDSTGLEDSTGIATAAQQHVTLVPNPATNSVTITAEAEILSVEAYNVKGQRIATAEGRGTTLKLDTSSWPNGTYTITIRTTKGTVTRKLVINK